MSYELKNDLRGFLIIRKEANEVRITNITLEMITVICFLIFICYESATMQKTVYKVEAGVWNLRIKRIGRMKRFLKNKDMVSELSLQPGIYRLGTGWFNDIRIYGCKSKVKLYLNIESKNKILLTVLKGEVEMEGTVLKENASIQKHITRNTTLFMDGIKIDLRREKD